jgi:hypothetical protein
MLQNNVTIQRQEEKTLLASLILEIDDIFFGLRKADQILRQELNLLNQKKTNYFRKIPINPINEEKLKKTLYEFPLQNLLMDEYVIYMLTNEDNSIFKLIRNYNTYLNKRINEQESFDLERLIGINEKLVYYIRNLGAMTYHLNIHLNLLTVLLRNSPVIADTQQAAIREIKEIMTEYMVNEWGEQLRDVRFLEITIDGAYALVTWALEDIRGDAILLQDEGYWQLINIGAIRFGLEDFDNAEVPLEVAQRMLRLHHQKLGY